MATRSRKPREVSGTANEIVREQKKINKLGSEVEKELVKFKKEFDKQTAFLKELTVEVAQLQNILQDAAQRMQADQVDDVFSIGHAGKTMAALAKKCVNHTKVPVEVL